MRTGGEGDGAQSCTAVLGLRSTQLCLAHSCKTLSEHTVAEADLKKSKGNADTRYLVLGFDM